MPSNLNRPGVIAAAAATGTVGILVFALLPIFIGQVAEEFQLNEANAGITASAYFVIYAIVSLSTPLWIRLGVWRQVAATGYLIMTAGLIGLLTSTDHTMVLVSMAVTGAGAATLLPISLTLVSDMHQTERSYAITVSIEQFIPALLLFVLSAGVIGADGLSNTIYAAIGITVLCAIFSYDLPRGQETRLETQASPSAKSTALLCLFALSLSFAGFAAMWAFFEIIAVQAGFPADFSTRWIATGLLMTAVGPLLAIWLADRAGRLGRLLIPTLIASGAAALLTSSVTQTNYQVTLVVFPLCYYIALSYVLAIIADADPNGVYASLMSFALAIGAIAGPGIYGYIREVEGPEVALISFLLVSGALLLTYVQRSLSRGSPTR